MFRYRLNPGGYLRFTTDVVIIDDDGSETAIQGTMMINIDFLEAVEV